MWGCVEFKKTKDSYFVPILFMKYDSTYKRCIEVDVKGFEYNNKLNYLRFQRGE